MQQWLFLVLLICTCLLYQQRSNCNSKADCVYIHLREYRMWKRHVGSFRIGSTSDLAWDCLPSSLHELTDTNTFKRQLKHFFFNRHTNRCHTICQLCLGLHFTLLCCMVLRGFSFELFSIRSIDGAECIMFLVCPSICACINACVPTRRWSLTGLPSTSCCCFRSPLYFRPGNMNVEMYVFYFLQRYCGCLPLIRKEWRQLCSMPVIYFFIFI